MKSITPKAIQALGSSLGGHPGQSLTTGGRPLMEDTGIIISPDIEYTPPPRPEGWVGAYSPQFRIVRIQRFLEKRECWVWTKKVMYDTRKNFADSRMRVKGKFVKKEDEVLMKELMILT
ncbi:hypothetical protein TrST_g839 [Triparma strigata]|uniref:CCT domain-containing protein n=1 Tax=Triparma strigata TaxID=1606541 RepID=A0A9W7C1W9_9STRA|nr:hypothetical protein TrST_g839 [Triparma strigata]